MTGTGRWRTTLHNCIIESINTQSVQKRYQQFLDSLEKTSTKILSVNYQAVAHRLESENWESGVLYSGTGDLQDNGMG